MVKLVQISLLIAVFFAIANADDNTSRVYENTSLFRYKNKVFYFENNLKLNWYGAHHFCKLHNMELASVESLDEHNAIVDNAWANGRAKPSWLAGNDLEANDVDHYYWANTGEKMTFFMWHISQPDNVDGAENCIYMFFDPKDGRWNDIGCTRMLNFICEMRI